MSVSWPWEKTFKLPCLGTGFSPSASSRTCWGGRKWARWLYGGRRKEMTWALGAQFYFHFLRFSPSHQRGKNYAPVQLSVQQGKYGWPLKKENCRSLFVLGWEGLLVNKYILIMRENWYANEGHHWQALYGRGRAPAQLWSCLEKPGLCLAICWVFSRGQNPLFQ